MMNGSTHGAAWLLWLVGSWQGVGHLMPTNREQSTVLTSSELAPGRRSGLQERESLGPKVNADVRTARGLSPGEWHDMNLISGLRVTKARTFHEHEHRGQSGEE